MATKLYLRNTTSNEITNTGDGVVYDLITTAGSSSTTGVVNTVSGGTNIQWTKTAGGLSMAWITGRVPSGGFTLTSVDVSAWLEESNNLANARGRFRIYKYTPGTPTITELGGSPFDDDKLELSTSPTEDTWTANVTDTAFAENDRILVKFFITNNGTMGASRTCTITFNAADAATGDSFTTLAETVVFKPELQTLTPSLFTNTNTFYTPKISFKIYPSLFANSNTFYSPKVNLRLTASLFVNTNVFYSPTVSRGAVTLRPSLFTNQNTFYSPTVNRGTITLSPSLFTNTNLFYSPTVTQASSTQNLLPSLFVNSNIFYPPTVINTIILVIETRGEPGGGFAFYHKYKKYIEVSDRRRKKKFRQDIEDNIELSKMLRKSLEVVPEDPVKAIIVENPEKFENVIKVLNRDDRYANAVRQIIKTAHEIIDDELAIEALLTGNANHVEDEDEDVLLLL